MRATCFSAGYGYAPGLNTAGKPAEGSFKWPSAELAGLVCASLVKITKIHFFADL